MLTSAVGAVGLRRSWRTSTPAGSFNCELPTARQKAYVCRVGSHGQYCPVSRGADLFGDRWTILIVRELQFGSLRFGEFERGLPGISRSVLSQRLRHLTHIGIIEPVPDETGYRLTAVGVQLKPVLRALGDWVAEWLLGDPSPAELDPELLMLFISRHVHRDALPERRVVVQFDFGKPCTSTATGGRTGPTRRIWLTLERHDVSICLHDPGLSVDLVVSGDVVDLYRVYVGRARLLDETAAERISVAGTRQMCRDFHTWMAWSTFAPATQRGLARRSGPA